jgi:hypothetical protein
VAVIIFRGKRKMNMARLSVTTRFAKKRKQVYFKYGFMKYHTKMTKYDFLQ